jgi:hypothetical protein
MQANGPYAAMYRLQAAGSPIETETQFTHA